MSRHIFFKMAAQNIKNNRRIFIPYLLTIMGTVAAYYIPLAMTYDPAVLEMKGTEFVQSMMSMGGFILLLFSAVFLVYTNSFVIKRRQKEMGLYSVLGMGKRHIALLISIETLMVAVIGIGGGLGIGMLFYKLCLLALYRLLTFPVPFGFYFSARVIVETVVCFAAIIAFILVSNLIHVMRMNTIQLIRSERSGEREPRAKICLTLLGVLTLGSGYYIAIHVTTAVEAIALYFAAVALVIIGTYLLFTTVSIAVMKLLKKNLSFYYKSRHFIALSGMLYRMKRNAVGLASICILSTMVLVMISGTVSLYAGTERILDGRCPADITTTMVFRDERDSLRRVMSEMDAMVEESGVRLEKMEGFRFFTFAAMYQGDGSFTTEMGNYLTDNLGVYNICVMPFDEIAGFLPAGTPCPRRGEAYFKSDRLEEGFDRMTVDFGTAGVMAFELAPIETSFVVERVAIDISDSLYLIVPDEEAMMAAFQAQAERYGEDASHMSCEIRTDLLDKSYEAQQQCREYLFANIRERLSTNSENDFMSIRVEGREAYREEIYAMNGSFLFLGVFLGLIFIMGAVLIIYYKQVTEGHDDRERYIIMQQVGLSRQEVKGAIRSQILMVFFLPLLVAALHVIFDFHIMLLLLRLFSVSDGVMVAKCTAVVFGIFAVIYAGVYALTARTYYKIVS